MKFRPWYLAIIVLVVFLGATALVTGGDQPGSIDREGDIITMTVNKVDANATAVFDIALQEGGDAEHESEHIFEVLTHQSIATLALDTAKLTLTVAYDSATLSEDTIREQLVQSGYVARSLDDAIAAELAADGTSQSIHLVPGEALEPSFISAKAGVPLTITFSAGTGHLASVSIEALGITEDLTQPGAAIVIDAPAVGEYELVCAEGYADATLVVVP